VDSKSVTLAGVRRDAPLLLKVNLGSGTAKVNALPQEFIFATRADGSGGGTLPAGKQFPSRAGLFPLAGDARAVHNQERNDLKGS
jgi:hypothetical protein